MITILTLQEYKSSMNLPLSDNVVEQDTQLTKFIEDATNQIDNLCGGLVFATYEKLDPEKDKLRIYKLKRAIMDCTLLLDQTNKMFYESVGVGGGSAPFSINTRNTNSDIENTRQDIIKSLVAGGWYKNLSIGENSSSVYRDSEDEAFNKLVVRLNDFFLRRDDKNTYDGTNLIFNNATKLNATGDIEGTQVRDERTGQLRKPILKNYNLDGSEVKFAENTQKIYDPTTFLNKFINEFDAYYFNGYTRPQIEELLNYTFQASGVSWSPDITYIKNFRTFIIVGEGSNAEERVYVSLIDNNKGNNPINSPDAWQYIPAKDVPIGEIVDMLKPYVEEYINSLEGISIEEIASDDAFNNFAKKNIEQTYTELQTFTGRIKTEEIEFNNNLTLFHNNNSAGYVNLVQLYEGSGYKNWTGLRFIRKDNGTLKTIGEIVMDADNNIRIDFVQDNGNLLVGNRQIKSVANGTDDTDAINKRQLDTKQNTLTAGTGITIENNVISATGGGSAWTEVLSVSNISSDAEGNGIFSGYNAISGKEYLVYCGASELTFHATCLGISIYFPSLSGSGLWSKEISLFYYQSLNWNFTGIAPNSTSLTFKVYERNAKVPNFTRTINLKGHTPTNIEKKLKGKS